MQYVQYVLRKHCQMHVNTPCIRSGDFSSFPLAVFPEDRWLKLEAHVVLVLRAAAALHKWITATRSQIKQKGGGGGRRSLI